MQRQSFRDWVLLAIDDRSSDDTRDIVREIAARDGRVVLVEIDEGPSSQAANWNRVIRLARTELVSMFGHDDVMMPALLELQVRMLEAHPEMALCFAQGPFLDVSSRIVPNKHDMPMMHPKWDTDRIWPRHEFGPEVVVGGFVHPSSVMMRTAIAQAIEPFPEDMPLYLDIDYWSRLGDRGSVGYVAGDLLRYRLNPDGAYHRCIRTGRNLGDANKLFQRMMAHWEWSEERRRTFRAEYYHAQALRAFREAEIAWKKNDLATARLQFAVCVALARSAGDDLQDWIARWWNVRFLGRRFSSPRRRKLLADLASMPVLRTYLTDRYLSGLPAEERP